MLCDITMKNDIQKIINRISSITPFPGNYKNYNKTILNYLYSANELSIQAREKGLDPSSKVESDIAFDLSDRVSRMFNLPLADRLRELLSNNRQEYAALQLAEEVSLGKFGFFNRKESLDLGIRVGLAVVTDGITVAPLQGISSIEEKKNGDGSIYISISFAGPIRSAGGTEAAFTLIIADHIRKVLGLDSYKVNSWNEDESGRVIEELRIYEREVSNFQFKVSDEDIQYLLTHMPVEVDGVETDPSEVAVHRDLKRIKTNRVRGGALRVINDGLIGRSRKLHNLVNNISISGWDWLKNLEGGLQENSNEDNTKTSHFQDIISGRPVLSMPNIKGGFRLRYGKSYNTGLSAIGIHPVIPILLDYPVVVGTQVKINLPGKAGVIAFVDTIDPPLVLLDDGTFLKADSTEIAIKIKNKLKKIIHLGDVLISFGDFLENNKKLPISGYVEEWWSQEVNSVIKKKYGNIERCSENIKIDNKILKKLIDTPLTFYPSINDAITISNKLDIPLHPNFLYYWNNVSISEVILLRNKIIINNNKNNFIIKLKKDIVIKEILEQIGIPHNIKDQYYIIVGDVALSIIITLGLKPKKNINFKWKNIEELLSKLSGIKIKNKSSTIVGIRMGRPEKAKVRKMRPPVHVLFPIGNNGGIRRDIIKASQNIIINIELINLICTKCGLSSLRRKCSKCGGKAIIQKTCPKCKRVTEKEICKYCKLNGLPYIYKNFQIKETLQKASKILGYIPKPPLKGVKVLINGTKITELLEKGLLRLKHNLTIYRDGTIRFDATNSPLTHFKPNQINTSIENLIKLGYKQDIYGKPLKNDDQIIELFVQDIILPNAASEHFFNTSKFLDELLVKFYKINSFYNLNNKEDICGHLVIGLAPHTSVGIIGRIIGFTNSQVCFAHPLWHSAKRRDCDGDEDTLILLLDVFLNFSKDYLPNQIGGLMDAPLQVQPIIIPKEVQRQAHNIDVMNKYPLKFYEETSKGLFPDELIDIIDIVRDRLDKKDQFRNFYFTHDTNVLSIDRERSMYSTLKTLKDKLDKQIEVSQKINAVDSNEVVTSVLNTHLIPDIIGNMKAYTSQSFRCKSCGKSYRRFPLKGECIKCKGVLQATVTRGSVEKYLNISLQLIEKYDVNEYIKNRFKIISEELESIFPKKDKAQLELTQFIEKNYND